MKESVFDCATGQQTDVDVAPDVEAALQDAATKAQAQAAKRDRQRQAAENATPGQGVLQKLASGAALTANEQATVTRWLALKLAPEIVP